MAKIKYWVITCTIGGGAKADILCEALFETKADALAELNDCKKPSPCLKGCDAKIQRIVLEH